VNKGLEMDADLFIGGNRVYRAAIKAGCNAVRIQSGKEGVRQALNESLMAATIRRQERERAERFKTLVENVHQGIVSVDRWGRITTINGDAKELLHIPNSSLSSRDSGSAAQLIATKGPSRRLLAL